MSICIYIYIYIQGRRFPSPFTVGTRAKIPVALYRGQEAQDSGLRDGGHEVEDSGRPLPRARGRRFPSPSTAGTRPTIPVAFYRGHEGEYSRRTLPGARG